MTRGPLRRRPAWSLVVWWLPLALLLWLVGKAVDQPASLLRCTASAALFAAVGELGDRLRRRLQRNA
ncbi:hypothetical protein [Streptomyces sp. NPDC026673]|uniref:hypothetical protein n=1 Tax=Streptomyces sp. NPDC026673 TaxID=3155724 RepID=UPI0033DE1FFE